MESDSSRRFSCLSEEEKTALLEKAISDSTKSATKFWISVLSEFASTKGMAIDFATVEEESLARLLENFYCSLTWKKEGTEYKWASYLAAQGAVQRELNRLNRRMNVHSPAFDRANKLLDATLKEKKRAGREEAVTHRESVSDLDWKKLKACFSDVLTTLDIKKLSFYVWFNTTLQHCMVNAVGPQWNNVTIYVQAPQAEKRNWRRVSSSRQKKKLQVEPTQDKQDTGNIA